LKNVTQAVLIAAMAAGPLAASADVEADADAAGVAGAGVAGAELSTEGLAAALDAGALGDDDAGADAAVDAAELLLPLLLLEQAVTATARDRPTAGTSRLR
jgi:hypothetical protein